MSIGTIQRILQDTLTLDDKSQITNHQPPTTNH